MRVAFASSDGKFVDQHFGLAERFDLWEIGPEQAEAIGKVVFCADEDDHEDKITARVNALDGCAMLYTTQIGGPAAAKLAGHHIHPNKAAPKTPIADAILQLQDVLRGTPPPWLRKAAGLPAPAVALECEAAD